MAAEKRNRSGLYLVIASGVVTLVAGTATLVVLVWTARKVEVAA